MATFGMDPAFNQTINALAGGVSGMPESYAAGQKHLLQQQIAQFNQNDKDRNYYLKKPLAEAQTRFHVAKATETEENNLAASLFPELSRKLLIPVRGMGGEPDRMAFNQDPSVLANVISNLTQRGHNPDQVIKAFRGGLAGQMAAAPVAGTSLPSANYQAFSGRVGEDFASTASSVFGIPDRDNMIANKELAAMSRVTQSGADALARAELAARTSAANNANTVTNANARAAAGIISRQEMNNQSLALANAKLGANGQKPPPLNISIINQVEGTSIAGTDGLSSRDVSADYPSTSTEHTEEKRTALKNLYAEKFYEAYRLKNPPDAAAARQAARNAVKSAVASGVMPVAAATTPAAAVSGTPAAASAYAAAPAAADTAPYAGAYSSPSQNMIDASDDQIAAGLGMSRDDLRALAKQQGISTKDYAMSVNTPAQEGLPAAEEEPGTPRTADTLPNYQESNVSLADALVSATEPGQVSQSLPASVFDPNSNEELLAQVTPRQRELMDGNNALNPPRVLSVNGEVAPEIQGRSNLTPEEQAIYDAMSAKDKAAAKLREVPFDKTQTQVRYTPTQAEKDALLLENESIQNPAVAVSGKKGKRGKKGKVEPVAATESPVAAAATGEQNLLKNTNFLTGTNRGNPHPYNLYSRPDPLTATMPNAEFTGKTYGNALDYRLADNSDALFLKDIKEKQSSTIEGLFSTGMPKEFLAGSTEAKSHDYVYKPDAVEQVMNQSGVDRKSAFGKRVEELQREKYSLMNSVASQSGPAMAANGLANGLQARVMEVNQKIDEIMNNPYAKISPSAALLVQDFINSPGLVVNSLSEVPNPENAKYVLKQSEVIHLLKTFTNVTIKPDGSYSVQYPVSGNKEESPMLSRYYSTAAEAVSQDSKYIDGDRMFAAFDRAHKDVRDLFIRQGKLGMKPGDSLARTLVNLTISSNKEIAASGKMGLLDPMSQPANAFQGAVQSIVK